MIITMKLYCPKCGVATAYTLKRPNFCAECGRPFGKVEVDQPDQEEGVAEESVRTRLNLKSLQVEIEAGEYKGTKIEEVAGTLSGGKRQKTKQTGNVNQEAAMEQFKKEAGSIKEKNK
jgi:hypothetical protein